MALWVQNVTNPKKLSGRVHEYEVKINNQVLAKFKHVRDEGAARCLRLAADAIDKEMYGKGLK